MDVCKYHIAQFQISAFPLSCPSFLGRGVPEAAVNYSLKFLSLISCLPSPTHASQPDHGISQSEKSYHLYLKDL